MKARAKGVLLGEGSLGQLAGTSTPQPDDIAKAAERLRTASARDLCPSGRVASAVAHVCSEIAWIGYQPGRESIRYKPGRGIITGIADRWGWSETLLTLSLQALCSPLARADQLEAFAKAIHPRRGLIGFIMAGNIPGAGLHELVGALLAGCAVLVKTASAEPIFFENLAQGLEDCDPNVGARIAVFNWGRERADLTTALKESCDRVVVFGDDDTVARLRPSILEGNPGDVVAADNFTSFGDRVSGVVLTAASLNSRHKKPQIVNDVGMDVMRFEQRGCLSPHHVFIEERDGGRTRAFAERLAAWLISIARDFPPPAKLDLHDAAAIRSAREIARWRRIGGNDVELWEGPLPGPAVIYDRHAHFTRSPGFRTVYVSPFTDVLDLERRLEPAKGRIEAFALKTATDIDSPERVAEIRHVLERVGTTYLCEPGQMQSPPLEWPHGGGAFLQMLLGDR